MAADHGTSPHLSTCGCGACGIPALVLSDSAAASPQAVLTQSSGPQGVVDGSVVLGDMPAGGLTSYGNTFRLHSLPSSTIKIYLDFDGFTTASTAWNSYWDSASFYSRAFSTDTAESFSSAELLRIQQVWQRVAEYFSPFNIDVTTEDPGTEALRYTGPGDASYGMRVVITDEDGKNFGGIGYVGSFTWNSDTPVFVYANRLGDGVKAIADAAAHETGHSLGLDHDGRATTEYYYGHGTGSSSWAPAMGAGYNASTVQWSNGGYNGASNTEDDLAIITSRNLGVTWRADDWGNTFATAGALGGTLAGSTASVQTFGVISGSGARNDVDMFWFSLAEGGSLDLTVAAWTQAFVSGSASPAYATSPFGMLDIGLTLYDSLFRTVASVSDPGRTEARLTAAGLPGGVYYLAVDGVGWGSPTSTTPTGWSDYGSLGQYMVRGSYSTGTAGPSTPSLQLTADRSSLGLSEGGSGSVTFKATGTTADIALQLSGVAAGVATLSTSQVILSAANNWTSSVTLSALDNRDADGAKAFTLTATSDVAPTLSIATTVQNDDIAPTNGGRFFGTYSAAPRVGGGGTAALSADNSTFMTIREGMTADGAGVDLRWQFTGLTPGDKLVQADAWSGTEAFRFEYSTDSAASWKPLAGAPEAALAWNGSWLATDVGSALWVRLVDAQVADDAVRDTIMIDLVTLAHAPGSTAAAGAEAWMFA